MAGAVLARNSGPKAMVGGGLAFAAFSYGIELYMRKAPAEWVPDLTFPEVGVLY